MKKFLSLVLAAMMLLAMVPALADDPVEIEYYFGLGGSLGDVFLGLVDEYNASQNKVHVTPVQFAAFDETQQGYQAALAAGNPPAVWQSQQRRWSAFEEYLAPLNEYYENDAEFNMADFSKGSMDCCYGKDGETLYGIPVYASTHVMYYRTDLFEGYDIEKTFSSWQNLAEACYEIVEKNPDVKYGMMPMWHCETWVNAVTSASGQLIYVNPEKTKVDFTSDAWVDVMTSFKKWFDDGIMFTHSGGSGWEYWYADIDDVMNGVAAGYTGSPADAGDLDFSKVACIVTPGWNGNEPDCVSEAHTLVITGSIPQEQKDAAWDFCKFLSSPTSQARITIVGGYLPTRNTTLEVPELVEYMKVCPAVAEATRQLNAAHRAEPDPTGGYVDSAMSDMYDNIFMNGMDVMEALELCQEEAQSALDDYWAGV